METEFDKEFDAILRRSAPGTAQAVGTDGHLAPDEIAAFAENALPEQAKAFYIEHLADCGRCRSILSDVIKLNEAEEPLTAPAPAAVEGKASVPWYRSLLRIPQLAAAAGAVVLVFAGILGYLVYQNSPSRQGDAQLTQVAESDRGSAAPESAAPANANLAISTANSAANSAFAASNAATFNQNTIAVRNEQPEALSEKLQAPAAARPAKAEDSSKRLSKPREEQTFQVDGQRAAETRVMTAPPAGAGVQDAAEAEKKDISALAKRKSAEAAAPQRTVGGKTFERRNDVWYDTSFSGQPTVNVRRGTEAFNDLDSGLRSIANGLRGTVVVVWERKAYRID